MGYKNILAPIDFSNNSLQAFEFAQKLALQNSSLLHIIHVIDSHLEKGPAGSLQAKNIMNLRMRNADEEMKKFINEIPHAGIEIIGVLKIGSPPVQILKYCEEQKIDLIVIASHGWSGMRHVSLGGIADEIMKHSNIPVSCLRISNEAYSREGMKLITH